MKNMKTMKSYLRPLSGLAVLALAFGSILPLAAAPLTWTDGAGNFLWNTTATNWTAGSGNIVWTSPNNAILGATGIGAITVSGTPTVSNLTVSAAGYSLVGGQINLGAASTAFQISNNITIGSVIGSANALVKSGAGTLTFTGTNTYTGGTTVNGGTLVLNAGPWANGILNGTATVNSGATLSIQGNNSSIFPTYFGDAINVNDGGTLSVAGGNNQDNSSYISAVNLASSALGASVTTPDNSILRLQGGLLTSTGAVANTFAANIVLVNPGSVTTTLTAGAGNTLNLSGVIKDYGAYPNTVLLFNGAGKVVLSGANTYGGTTTISAGTLQVGNGGSGAAIGNTSNVVNNASLIFNHADDLSFARPISGTGSLTRLGAGTLTLTATNSYTGTTTVSNGTLLVNGALGSTAVSVRSGAAVGGIGKLGGSLTLVSGAILDLAVTSGATNGVTVAGAATLTGTITVSPVRLGGAALLPGTYTVLTASGGRSGAHSFSWSDPVGQFATATFATNGSAITVSLAAAAPTVTTLAATNITATMATLKGTVNPNGAVLSTNYFQYGLTTNYGSFSATNTLTATYGISAVTSQLTGLAPGTGYHYRLVAANSAGASYGSDLTFTNLSAAPTVTTLAPSNITATGATLNGTVNPGGGVTTAYFQYGLTTDYGSFSPTNALAATNALLNVTNRISGLAPATVYHYRVLAANAAGTNSGSDLTFTNLIAAPAVLTLAASGVSNTVATLNGTVNPGGGVTTAYFQYGLTTDYGSFSPTNALAATNAVWNVPNLISGLASATVYHYRVVAANSAGTSYGSNFTFTTIVLDTGIKYVALNNSNPASPYLSWATAATNIQDAINAAVPGNTVLVSNGVYGVGTTQDDQAIANRVVINKALTVRSVNGPAVTTISGGSNIRCAWMTNNALLAGFTITNGYLINGFSSGGGVYAASASVVISNCLITGSKALNAGGVYRGTLYDCTLSNNIATATAGGGYSNTLYRCTLVGNTSRYNGGGVESGVLFSCILISNQTTDVYSDGGGAYASTLTNCTLTANNGFNGGGAGNSTLDNCTLSNNIARAKGGGMSYSGLINCTLFGNTASLDGGGAAWGTLTNCTLVNNASGKSYSGGGAYTSVLNNCLVVSNTANNGGGIQSGELTRCQLLKNTATAQGGGGNTANMNNCLLLGNRAHEGGGSYGGNLTNCTIAGNLATLRGGGLAGAGAVNCIVYLNTTASGNYPNHYNGVFSSSCTLPLPPPYRSPNIDADPQFVNAGSDDYHLQAASPCLDIGDNAAVATVLDLDGNPRLSSGTVDLGAYEFPATNAPVAFRLAGTKLSAGGAFQLSFTNLSGLGFSVLGSTNVALPVAQWTVLGPVVESPAGSGQYQFLDPSATNHATLFYRVRSH